jgi:hypothetical protein
MEKFKGTKGKWKLAENQYCHYTSVRNLDDSRKVCVSRVNNQIESNANLLLISKAPEMLEMLEKVLTAKFTCEEIKQLIKEATEI